MAIERFANGAQTVLASAIDASATSLSVADSSSFPSGGNFRVRVDSELMLVTGVSGTTWTVIRGVEGTLTPGHSSGAPVVQVLTAGALTTYLVPVGMIMSFAGATAPSGWLACDGSAVSRTTYEALFSAIGTTWGTGDGSTTFNLPDFRRRVPVGSGGTGTGTLGNAVGNTGGAETHTLTTSEMPAHNHPIEMDAAQGTNPGSVAAGTVTTAPAYVNPYTPTNVGGGNPHNNVQPSAVVLMCVKA